MKLGAYPAYRLWRRREARKSLVGAIGYSQFMTERHEPHIPSNVSYIPLGINLNGCTTERVNRPHSPLRFGFIAGFQPTKGILHILDSAQNLKREGLSFEVHVWGPSQEQGRNEIASRDLQSHVILRGMYSLNEIWDVYSQIDVAIMATLVSEPFGRVVQEAAAVGAPTIGVRAGGIS
jgi:glycosyltransferase involved in cell wall biosynthesis